MFDGDDDDDDHDDCASTTTTSPSSSSPDYDDDDVEILLDRSRTLIVKAKDAECKCSCANREECNGQSGSEEKANDVGRNYDQMSSSSSALRNGGDWKVKEWKAGDNSMTSSSSPLPPLPPLPPLHPPVTDDLESCQSSMTSFVAASQSRRDASSSSESREELSLLCQQRSSICGSTTGEKPSRCQRRRHGRPLDCAAGKSNPASDEQKAPVPWRANARCQQVVAPCRPPPPQLRSFLSEMADRRCPVINIRRATLYVNSRIGFNREKGKSNGQSTTTTKDLAPRQKNRRSDRPKTKTEIQPGPGSFRCHRAPPPRLPSLLRSLELDGDSRYPSPSSPSSASPYPRPSPVSDDLPVERAPEEERVGGNAASSEKSDWKKEKKKEEEDEEEESEKCSFKRMLDLTIVCLIVAVVLLSIFSYVFGPSKTKDSDPC